LDYIQIKNLAELVDANQHQALVGRIRHAMSTVDKKWPPLEQMQAEAAEFIQHHTEWVHDINTKQDFELLLQRIDFNNDDNLRQIFGETGIKKKKHILKAIAEIQHMSSGYERPFCEDGRGVYCSGTREEQVRHRQQVDMSHVLQGFFRSARDSFWEGEKNWSNDPIHKMGDMVAQKEIDLLRAQPEASQALTWLLTNIYREANGETIRDQLFPRALEALQEKYPEWKEKTSFGYNEVLTATKGLYDLQDIILDAAREVNKSAKSLDMDSKREGTLRGKIDPASGALSVFKDFTDLKPMREGITEIAINTARIPVALLDHLARNPRALETALKNASIVEDKKQAIGG